MAGKYIKICTSIFVAILMVRMVADPTFVWARFWAALGMAAVVIYPWRMYVRAWLSRRIVWDNDRREVIGLWLMQVCGLLFLLMLLARTLFDIYFRPAEAPWYVLGVMAERGMIWVSGFVAGVVIFPWEDWS